MVNLNWKGKNARKNNSLRKHERIPFQVIETHQTTKRNLLNFIIDDNWQNRLICGDNKDIITSLLKEFASKINLIYIDPPFATGGDFNYKIQIGEKGQYLDKIAYKDKWKEGLESYLNFLRERLILMKKLLSNSGSIYIHLDWHVSHYIKIIMDEIFGNENFRNEIIWAYPAASAQTRRFFVRSYDTILFYSKSEDYVFNNDPNIYMEYSDRVKNALKQDEKGTFYYRGGSHDGKKLSRKVYLTQKGIFPRDLWNDIPYIRANTLEYQGFSTQKPERLLKRIILASTNKNDLVADFFCGSGTTLAVAEKLGRHWIGCDLSKHAIHMTRKRILDVENSNDILNWNKKYNKKPNSFKILSLDNAKKKAIIPREFLSKEIKNKELLQNRKNPDFIVSIKKNQKNIVIELKDYISPNSELISDNVKKKITTFSDWIDYWSIDFNYQSNIFNNEWVSYRTPKNRTLNLITSSYSYKKPGIHVVMIKLIDILGIETMQRHEIKIK
ncbi:MAG: site-specific DNA-methyltransferase [Promethearchaeota archaeon]